MIDAMKLADYREKILKSGLTDEQLVDESKLAATLESVGASSVSVARAKVWVRRNVKEKEKAPEAEATKDQSAPASAAKTQVPVQTYTTADVLPPLPDDNIPLHWRAIRSFARTRLLFDSLSFHETVRRLQDQPFVTNFQPPTHSQVRNLLDQDAQHMKKEYAAMPAGIRLAGDALLLTLVVFASDTFFFNGALRSYLMQSIGLS